MRASRSRSRGRAILAAGLITVAAVAIGASAVSRLAIPAPTGAHDVGRERLGWTDASRHEQHTSAASDLREVIAEVWFPAVRGSGAPAPYIDALDRLRPAFVASGEVDPAAAAALRFVRANARAEAMPAPGRHPVIVLSPGNATNVAFQASLAEELASHGYIVVGVDHPFHATGVVLADGSVATYREGAPVARVEERVADIRFVLDRLADLDRGGPWVGRLDLERVGIIGHSLGGIAAVEACKADARLRACANIDGQMAGGPLGARSDASAPSRPFMYLTKESFIHPVLERRLEQGAPGIVRVVVPEASHDQFADTALFRPAQPFDRTAERVMGVMRGFSLAFFEHALNGAPRSVFRGVDTTLDVYVNVYPLSGRPSLPLGARPSGR